MATTNALMFEHLSADQKRQLVAALVRSLLTDPGGALSVTDAAGELVVYVVPADARARAERAMRTADPATLAELDRRAATPEQVMTLEEVMHLPVSPPRPPE